MKKVKVVIGANFGDEGKGLMTDYFASKEDNAIVVLHNGGAQRGHTVVTPEGYRHVFRHFGSGTYIGAATYIAKEFIVNPILFRQEYEKLAKHGCVPKVYINKKCKLTTIYDMLINQVLEADRGINKHGSCGVGVFETIYRNKDGVDFKNPVNINPAAMTVGEFMRLSVLNKIDFLDYLRKNYVPKRFDDFGLKNISVEFMNVLTSNAVIMNFIDDFEFMIEHSKWANDDILNYYDNSFIGYSYSKSLSLPGERIGYVVVNSKIKDFKEMVASLNIANRILGFVNAPSLFQRVIKESLNLEVDSNIYKKNRDLLYNHLIQIGFECMKPEGTFYLFPKSPIDNDVKFCEDAKKFNILAVPGSTFGCPGYFRLSYCISYEKIEKSLKAFDNLMNLYKS